MSATSPYHELAAELRERIAVIADRGLYARDPAAHLEKLKAVSGHIITLAAALPPPLDPRLRHFLEGSSYQKALAFLEERHGA